VKDEFLVVPLKKEAASSNSHFEKISLCVIVQHVKNICKGSRRRFLLRCNQYFFHRSLNAPIPVELYLNTGLPATCPQCFATRGRRVARRSGEAGGKGDRFNCGSLLGLSSVK